MKEKFKFTDWQKVTWDGTGEIVTYMYGERNTEDSFVEKVFIRFTLKATKQAVVVFRHYLGNCLLAHREIGYTNTMEMMQAVKDYIDNLEK